jgi:hypothetical protein
MRRFVSFVVASCLSLALFASPGDVFPLEDAIYGEMDTLFLSSGVTSPSTARPWSEAEARNEFSRLEKASVPAGAMALYEKMERKLSPGETCQLHLGFSLAPEAYVHSNTSFDTDGMWVYGWTRRKPFATLSLEGASGGFSTMTSLSYGWGRVTYKDTLARLDSLTDSWVGLGALVPKSDGAVLTLSSSDIYSRSFLFNFPDMKMLEIDLPRRTVFSFGSSHFSLSVSRDRLSWGNSHIGNFIFDSHVDRFDYLSFKAFSKTFAFSYIFMPMDGDYSNANNGDYTGKMRFFLAHRLDWKPLSWFSFAISENVMVTTSQVDVQLLNPAFIFHNLNNSSILNAIAHLEVEVVPFRGWKLFGQFCLDQAQAPTETDPQPAAWGLSGGVRNACPVGKGTLASSVEAAYTTPWLYRRQGVDFLMFHRYATNVTYQKIPLFTYMGFPYGGDAIVLEADATYRAERGWELFLKGFWLCHGEVSMYSCHSSTGSNDDPPDRKGMKTPSGNAAYSGWIDVGLSWPFAWSWGKGKATGDFAVVSSGGAWDVQFMMGVELGLRT